MRSKRHLLLWGSGLILFGLFWLLHVLGVLGLGRMLASSATVLLLLLAASAFAAHRADRARWGLLVLAASLVALAALTAGEAFAYLPEGVPGLLFFAAPAAAFARVHNLDRRRSWALLAAWLCAVLGLTSFVGARDLLGGHLVGAVFLAGVGLGFAWHFLRTGRDWALLAAGFLLTFALVPVGDAFPYMADLVPPAVLFGIASTFAALYLLGRPGAVAWARYPAAVFVVLGACTALAILARPLLLWGVPVALIALGGYFLIGGRGEGPLGEGRS